MMSEENKKQLWNKQRAERDKIRKEFQQKLLKLKEETLQKEVAIEMECETQIQSEQKMSALDFDIKIRQECELFKAKESEIESKYRTQEMLEKTKLRDDFERRMEKFMTDEKIKQKDIVDRNAVKAKQQLTEQKINYRRELDSAIESIVQQIVDLEEKLKSRERDLLDAKRTSNEEQTTDSGPKVKPQIPISAVKLVEPQDSNERTTETVVKMKEKPKTKTEDKKVQKKENKKQDKKKNATNKPWDNLNKFDQ